MYEKSDKLNLIKYQEIKNGTSLKKVLIGIELVSGRTFTFLFNKQTDFTKQIGN